MNHAIRAEFILYNKSVNFIVDSGASCCIIDQTYIPKWITIDDKHIINIRGVNGINTSQGCVETFLQHGNYKFPITFHVVSNLPKNVIGLIGTDFLNQYKSKINFEKSTLTLIKNLQTICIPLNKTEPLFLTIPARTEIVTFISTYETEPCVILAQEIISNVFIANTLANPINGRIPVRIMNVRNHPVDFKFVMPQIRKSKYYDIFELGPTPKYDETRIKTLMSELNLNHLKETDREIISKICIKYADVFCLKTDSLGTTPIYKQSIGLKPHTQPLYTKPYKLPHAQKVEVENQVDSMLKNNIIEESKSAWNSPILLVPKKSTNDSKKWRLVIDYRKVNSLLQDDKFPLPNIDDVIDSLAGAKYFTHLDLSQGYYQCELKQEDRPITAFSTSTGQYQMTRLPMGLKISPSAFSRLMTVAMTGLNLEKCLIYLDDLIIFGKTFEEHNKNLVSIFERLRKVNLKLNPLKCSFLKKELVYLGHFISAEGIKPDPAKIECVKQWPLPTTADQVKRFIAFANYYRKHIPNFAQICEPLNLLTRKNITFKWTDKCQYSFDKLREKFINPPILDYPDFSPDNKFILKTDASGFAIGSVLSNRNGKPIAYASKALNKAEKNYATIEKELLAIVWSIKHFRPYLYGRKFEICTDHKPLIYLFSMKDPSSRLTKFRLLLEEYDFDITYIQGKNNMIADALSRISITKLKEINNKINENIFAITRMQSSKLNKVNTSKSLNGHNVFGSKIFEIIIENNMTEEIKMLKEEAKILIKPAKSLIQLRRIMKSLEIICKEYNINELVIKLHSKNAQIFYKEINENELLKGMPTIHIIKNNIVVVNDDETKNLIMNDFHMLPTAGHAGIKRTLKTLKQKYVWKNMNENVENFIKKCTLCQKNKNINQPKIPMTITSTATSAFEKIYLDLVGPIIPDEQSNQYILTTQCELTKFITATPIKNKSTESVAKAFVENVILLYGVPKEIATDRGTEFMSNLFTEVCKLLHINKINSVAYHHQSIGALENSHKVLGNFLRIHCGNNSFQWASWIPYYRFAYNTTVHTETNKTPFELVFGKLCTLPSNLHHPEIIEPLYNFDDYCKKLKYKLQLSQEITKNKLLQNKQNRTKNYNENLKRAMYKPGQLVLIKNETCSKLDKKYLGPFPVVSDKNPNVEIRFENKTDLIHKQRIKPFVTD